MYKNRKRRTSGVGAVADKLQTGNSKFKSVLGEKTNQNVPPANKQQKVDLFPEDDIACSQASIPASQPPTQRRYLSQRSNLCKTQSKTMTRAPNNYFEMILMKSGVDLDQPDNYILSCDHLTFVNRFRSILNKHQDYPENIKSFTEGFRDALDNDDVCTLKLFSGCSISSSNMETITHIQDSMVLNFLMIDFLQKDIIEIVLNKVEKCAEKEDLTNSEVPIIALMLSQLKFVAGIHADYLYDKFLPIYERSSSRVKEQLIMSAENVICPSKHDDFVSYLIDNSDSNEDLFHQHTIQMFSNLFLGNETKAKLRRRVLQYIKDGCRHSLLPLFIKFLFKMTSDDVDVYQKLISEIRLCLSWNYDCPEEQNKQIQTDIFTCISHALTRSKKMYDTWQKIIVNASEGDFRPMDFIVALILISVREEKSAYIENIIRRRIKLEQIKIGLLNETRNLLFAVLAQYADTILQMVYNFIRDKNILVKKFAKHACTVVFGIEDCDRKNIISKLVEIACDKTESDLTTLSLEVLHDLRNTYKEKMQSCGLLLLPLLDRITDFDLSQYRMVMELLCSIAYPSPDYSECQIIQDHIDMLVKKQIISATSIIKMKGIIGMVQLVNHIALTDETGEDMYDLNITYNSLDELPEGRGKLAANYIGRIISATNYCPESLALFYDEMAAAYSHASTPDTDLAIEPNFLIWFSDLITNYFQNYFIVEDEQHVPGIKLTNQNCINEIEQPRRDDEDEDEEPQIAVNIAGATFKQHTDAGSSILILPSLFNLVHTLHFYRFDQSLESINAVLGCALVLPDFLGSPSDYDIFTEYDESVAIKIMDTHFHTANWYREIISGFSRQTDSSIIAKVLKRLSTLIKLEESIKILLTKAPNNYHPPISNFVNYKSQGSPNFKPPPAGRPKKGQPKEKSSNKRNEGQALDSQGMSMIAPVRTLNASVANISRINLEKSKTPKNQFDPFEDGYGSQQIFRQMDNNIILLLKKEICIDYPLPNNKIGSSIGLLEFRFILSDLVSKIESISGVKKLISNQHSQFIFFPNSFLYILIHNMEHIVLFFNKLSNFLNSTLDSVKHEIGNPALFSDEINYMKVCFGLCLRLFAGLITCPRFEDESKENDLNKFLRAINITDKWDTISKEKTTKEIAAMAFDRFIQMERVVIDIKSAVHLFHFTKSLSKFSDKCDNEKEIIKLCRRLLCRKWCDYDGTIAKGALYNVLLNELIKGFFENSSLKVLTEVLKTVSQEVKSLRKNTDCLASFPNIHKANFPMLFRALCEALITAVNRNVEINLSSIDTLRTWEKSCAVLNMILSIVKSLDIPRNFSLYLKYAHFYLKIFLQHGISIFENSMRKNPERVNDFLKSLQVTTRFLHNLCCHSKAIKNTAVVGQIPALRETIENLLFKVKAALAANNCSSVFWMGNLKNKDLQGDEILSQNSSLTTRNDESDEELPDDDNSIDETVVTEDKTTSRSGTSKSVPLVNTSSRSDCF